MQIDWGHFGSLHYGDTTRKLYAMAVIESYSRMSFVEFTHSQNQQALHQCLLNAFRFFGGTPEQIVVDYVPRNIIRDQYGKDTLEKRKSPNVSVEQRLLAFTRIAPDKMFARIFRAHAE